MKMELHWDRKNRVVLEVVQNNGDVQSTGLEPMPDAELEWVQAKVDLPLGYIDELAHLLGNPVFSEVSGEVVVSYPDADFSVGGIRNDLERTINAQLQQFLDQTDWVVIRSVEQGKDIPEEYKAQRDALRKEATRLKGALRSEEDPKSLISLTGEAKDWIDSSVKALGLTRQGADAHVH